MTFNQSKQQAEKIDNELGRPFNWNSRDINWAAQQIRPTGKPAGDVEKMNNEAARILVETFPSVPPVRAGELALARVDAQQTMIEALSSEIAPRFAIEINRKTRGGRSVVTLDGQPLGTFYAWKARMLAKSVPFYAASAAINESLTVDVAIKNEFERLAK